MRARGAGSSRRGVARRRGRRIVSGTGAAARWSARAGGRRTMSNPSHVSPQYGHSPHIAIGITHTSLMHHKFLEATRTARGHPSGREGEH